MPRGGEGGTRMRSLTSLPPGRDISGYKKNFIASDWTKIQDGKWKAAI